MKPGAGIAWGAGAAGLLALGWLVWGSGASDAAPAAQVAGPAAPWSAAIGPGGAPVSAPDPTALASSTLAIDAVGDAIANSSLRGSTADGDWGIDAAGRFRPSRELRRRFDYYLSLQGEVPLDALQRWIEAQVRKRHGAAAAAQVMPIFASYLRLQQYPWRIQADPRRPQSLGPALAERMQVRRELLGIEVAEAFYREDDAQLQALIAQANTGGAPAATTAAANAAAEPSAPEPLPDAPVRMAQLQTQWDDWDRRVAGARAELARVNTAPELSAPQRAAAINGWLTQHFDPSEQQRAKALLQLPPE